MISGPWPLNNKITIYGWSIRLQDQMITVLIGISFRLYETQGYEPKPHGLCTDAEPVC